MKRDMVVKLLEQVASGDVSVEDARAALDGVELDEDTYISALDHGVFNEPDPGTIVRASMSPTGESALVVLTFVWGLAWTLYWAGATTYGLFADWNQQLLSFFFGMTMVTLIIMGIVYLKWVMPDVVIVKHRRNKYMSQKDPDSWFDYKV